MVDEFMGNGREQNQQAINADMAASAALAAAQHPMVKLQADLDGWKDRAEHFQKVADESHTREVALQKQIVEVSKQLEQAKTAIARLQNDLESLTLVVRVQAKVLGG